MSFRFGPDRTWSVITLVLSAIRPPFVRFSWSACRRGGGGGPRPRPARAAGGAGGGWDISPADASRPRKPAVGPGTRPIAGPPAPRRGSALLASRRRRGNSPSPNAPTHERKHAAGLALDRIQPLLRRVHRLDPRQAAETVREGSNRASAPL